MDWKLGEQVISASDQPDKHARTRIISQPVDEKTCRARSLNISGPITNHSIQFGRPAGEPSLTNHGVLHSDQCDDPVFLANRRAYRPLLVTIHSIHARLKPVKGLIATPKRTHSDDQTINDQRSRVINMANQTIYDIIIFVCKPANQQTIQSLSISRPKSLATDSRALAVVRRELVQLRLERLDRRVRVLEVLVEPVALRDELLSVLLPLLSPSDTLTCCSHCLKRASSSLTCSVKRLRSCSSSSRNFALSIFLTFGSPNLRVSICASLYAS